MCLLLDHGADVDSLGFFNSYRTPLGIAVEAESEEIVRILLEHGADPHLKSPWLSSALEIAKRKGLERMARLLREHESHGSQKSS